MKRSLDIELLLLYLSQSLCLSLLVPISSYSLPVSLPTLHLSLSPVLLLLLYLIQLSCLYPYLENEEIPQLKLNLNLGILTYQRDKESLKKKKKASGL